MAPRPSKLTVTISQLAPTLGNIAENIRLHRQAIRDAAAHGSDLLVFPELSTSGYMLRDMVPEVALGRDDRLWQDLGGDLGAMGVVLGFVEESDEHQFYNSAAYLTGNGLEFVHRKVYLPTYGMFDERRYFAAGNRIRSFKSSYGRIGLLICEDFWHLSSAVIFAAEHVDYLICISNSPGRDPNGAEFGTSSVWRDLIRCYARFLGCPVIFANRVGFEDGVCFWGGSEVVGPNGDLIAQAPALDPILLPVEIDVSEIRRARIRTPVARDERILLTIAELDRIKAQNYS